ncbi:salicylate carboxymethyltransferase-like isoform X2 [Mercurialis annua]|uniref:salicylate carboxymethyltransferase-like isoform X2 n=1 Tax=Mercurialis annua TaxID=3986 RepID=UPI0024AD9145|nr:salicylate carboxymethyltransferase-like isoform X2 [Mercurialis annua]
MEVVQVLHMNGGNGKTSYAQNSLLQSLLPDFQRKMKEYTKGQCFVSGTPGSFHGRLFPTNTLHFAYSSSSLHWLSQVPRGLESNKGNIYINSTSPSNIVKEYCSQFQKDFLMFLECRSKEMRIGGYMVLTFLGRRNNDPSAKECCYLWELLAMALNQLVLEGMIDEEKFNSFNIPFYAPSPLEVKCQVDKQGSFCTDKLEIYEHDWNECRNEFDPSEATKDVGIIFANFIKSGMEPLIINHFGFQEAVIDEVFNRYSSIVNDCMAKEKNEFVYFILSITKKDD